MVTKIPADDANRFLLRRRQTYHVIPVPNSGLLDDTDYVAPRAAEAAPRRKANSLDEQRPRPKLRTAGKLPPIETRSTFFQSEKLVKPSPLKSRPDILDAYRPIREIGKGAFGTVYAVEERNPTSKHKKVFACKILQTDDGDEKANLPSFLNEVELMMANNGHPNLQDLVDFAIEGDKAVIISTMCYGGDLKMALEKYGKLSEKQARAVMSGVFRGLSHLHSQGIAHRDVKLDNILMVDKGDLCSVKIIDMGFAKKLHSQAECDEALHTVCGTPLYIAPELIHKSRDGQIDRKAGYDIKVDMWACGIIMFTLLSGIPPFSVDRNKSIYELFDEIKRGKFVFDDYEWKGVSESAKDLITSLLNVDPKKRTGASSALRHAWFLDSGMHVKSHSAQ